MARKLVVEIVGDASSLDKTLRHASGSVQKFSVGIGTLVKSAAVFDAVQAGFRGVTSAIGASIDEFTQQQQVAGQTAAVLKSTGQAAGVTAKQVDQLATSIANYSGIDDEAVQAGENMLLTFTRVRNQVGAGNDIFNQATKVVADLATAMNKGAAPSMDQMAGASLQVGKALNDPIKGYARLQRIGVQFTASQVAQIKGFVRVGDTLDAQRVILAELTKEFGGSAREMGKTVPGEINRIRESFRNLGGDLVGQVAPAFADALEGVNRFVQRLSKAQTVRAKLQVVWEGIKDVAVSAFNQLRDAFNAINWDQVWQNVQQIARSLLSSLVAAFGRVDWGQVGTFVGQKLAGAENAIRQFLERVNWNQVGKVIIDGILVGLGALTVLAANFFRKAVPALIRLWLAELKALRGIVIGAGGELGRLILNGVEAGLQAAGDFLKKLALKIVLDIIEPFTHLPFGAGKPAQELKEKLQRSLEDLGKSSKKTATDTGAAIGGWLTDGIKLGVEQGGKEIPDTVKGVVVPAEPAIPAAPRAGVSAGQRNTFFDNMINRAIGRVQDISSLQGQIARLNQIAGLIQQRINATKDITRRLNLEDKLLEVQRQARSLGAQLIDQAKQAAAEAAQRAALARQAQIDQQQLAIARAQATPGFEDNLATEQHLVQILKRQLAADKTDVGLQRQLFDAEQAVKDTLKQRSDAAKQAKIDAASLALQRAELTKTLTDDLAAAINQVAVLKKTGATASEILSAQANVKDKRDQIAQQRKDDVQKARQAKVDAADLAVLRAQLTKTLSDDLAAAIHRLGVLRKTGAAESDIVSAMLDVKDKRQQQAQATKDAAKAAKETAAAARQAAQFARLGFGPTGGDTLPSGKALQKRLGRLEDAVQGTILDTPRMQARLNHLRQVLSGSLGKVGGDVRVKIKAIMDGITQALQKKTKPPKKGTIADVIMTIFDPSSVPKDFILGPGIQLRRPTPGEKAAARFEAGPDLRRRLPGTVGGPAGAAAGRGIARGLRLPRGVTGAADFMRLPRGVTGAADFKSRPTTVVVNQFFQKPTVDLHREARYAKIATRSVFDQ